MGRRLFIMVLSLDLCHCSGGDPRNFQGGHAYAVVQADGDQINPDLEGRWLVWFDLEEDPNGACHTNLTPDPQAYDNTCQGVIKSKDLLSGRVRTLSEELQQDTQPVVSEGLVIWRCLREGAWGLCVTRADRREIAFHPLVSGYYYYGQTKPAADRGMAAWIDYNYQGERPVNLLRSLELRTGQEASHATYDYPSELVVYGHRLAWVSAVWDQDVYLSRLESLDTQTGEHQVLFESERTIQGLGGSGDLLAFKLDLGDASVGIYYLDSGDQPVRADSSLARVSSMTPVSVDEDLLVWLDHREGNYRVAACDLRGGQEGFVSSGRAVVGAYQAPAADQDRVVWADRRDGDWDLYLRSL